MSRTQLGIIAMAVAFVMLGAGIFFGLQMKGDKATPKPSAGIEGMPTEPADPVFPEATEAPDLPIAAADVFTNPGAEYRPYKMVHSWLDTAWNNGKANNYKQRLDYLVEIGFGGVVTNVPWDDKYLTNDKAFESLTRILDYARGNGLGTWLYDEYWYPSGYADQLTMEGHPEYEAIGVSQIARTGTGSAGVTVMLSEDVRQVLGVMIYPVQDGSIDLTQGKNVSYTLQERKLQAPGQEGSWEIRIFCTYPVEIAADMTNDASGQIRTRPNLLNKAAVARFIEVTHQQYKDKISDFSSRIIGIFTDEPALAAERYLEGSEGKDYPLLPWEGTLAEHFWEKFGYELLPYLPSLFGGTTELDKQVRQNYYETVGDMFTESYTAQIQSWCKANGTELSGHLLFEESLGYQIPLYGDMFQQLCNMGYPGIDDLSMFPESYTSGGLFLAAKMASSAARYRNISKVMVELCPVIETDKFYANHHEYALATLSQLYISGINQINCYYDPARSSNEEARIFTDYAARMSYMLEDAVMSSGIGVFYSTKTSQQYYVASSTQDLMDTPQEVLSLFSSIKDITTRLSQAHLDFDFFTEQILDSAAVKDGKLYSGSAQYSVIILPSVELLPLRTMQKLDRFASQGGTLIFTGCLPSKSNIPSESPYVKALAEKYQNNLMYTSAVGNVPNLALHAAVTAMNTDSAGGIYEASNVTDGTPDPTNWNGSWSGSAPGWVEIDLGQEQTFDTAILYTQNGYEMMAYDLQYWDGSQWKTIASVQDNTKDTVKSTFAPVTAQKVRVATVAGSTQQPGLARINELELYNATDAGNKKSLLDTVKNASAFRLTVTEKDSTQAGQLMVSQYDKYRSMFYMLVNPSTEDIAVTLTLDGAKGYKIYNPYDGSITDLTGSTLTIPSYRGLFIEPIF